MKSFKDPSPPRKRHFDVASSKWNVGDEVEQEWTEPNYRQVFHPVRILKINGKNNTATVQMLAFTEDSIVEGEDMNYFHPYRVAQPNYAYQVGDRVHFKMYNRKVRGRNVDGNVGIRGEGVWVKGVVTEIKQNTGELRIRHIDWSSKKPEAYTQCWVERRDLRPEEYNL
jgi:hypothetical protein